MSRDTEAPLPGTRALLAVPGSIAAPTGGYAYARALLARARAGGLHLDHWPLPDGFPDPDAGTLAEAGRRIAAAPAGWPLIVDGLALGVMPAEMLAAHDGPLLALCHHPLALETGLAPDRAEALMASEKAALAACDGVIVTSAATGRTLVERYNVPAERITVAPPGTDPAPHARGSGGPSVHLLSIGSIVPRKGHDVLIAALARLANLDWRLTIVGDTGRDPACTAALEAAIAENGLSGRVTLAGAADAAALDALHDHADLFVLASRHEGYGMAFAEAMARALPVVGCEAGAVAEATRGAARLVPPDDPEALAEALRPLLADQVARASLATACATAAEALPRWEETVGRIADALARAAERVRAEPERPAP